jgi:alpha-tubulin suppressor-like RCC1 family protein
MFSRLYAGEHHTCGLTPAGVAFCWGKNSSGQLGNGTTASTNVPVAVSGGLTFRSLAMGELHTCGIVGAGPGPIGTTGTQGELRCWGDNEYGQLGIGPIGVNAVSMLVPTRVIFQQ